MSKKSSKSGGKSSNGKAKAKAASTGEALSVAEIDKAKRQAKVGKATKGSNGKEPAKQRSMSCLDAAAEVLRGSTEAMNCKSLIEAMKQQKLWFSDAPRPTPRSARRCCGRSPRRKTRPASPRPVAGSSA